MRTQKNRTLKVLLVTIFTGFSMLLVIISCNENTGSAKDQIWTFTYLKANKNQTSNLKTFIERNWFVMDSIAVDQKLIQDYVLYENTNSENSDWDLIVAVSYFSKDAYAGITSQFEEIREKHQEVKINNLGFKDLGKVIRSETVIRNLY